MVHPAQFRWLHLRFIENLMKPSPRLRRAIEAYADLNSVSSNVAREFAEKFCAGGSSAGAELPTAPKQIEHAVNSFWDWAKTGFDMADDQTRHKRRAGCMECPRLAPAPPCLINAIVDPKHNEHHICGECGCLVGKKIRYASEKCPESSPDQNGLSRWGEPLQG